MTVLNIEYFLPKHKRIVRAINDTGEILLREDLELYNEIVSKITKPTKITKTTKITKPTKETGEEEEEEKVFLDKLYICLIEKLKEVKFD